MSADPVVGVIDASKIHDVVWHATPALRWQGRKGEDPTLQQMYTNFRGEQDWRAVPVVIEK